jgi:hypothetical protein
MAAWNTLMLLEVCMSARTGAARADLLVERSAGVQLHPREGCLLDTPARRHRERILAVPCTDPRTSVLTCRRVLCFTAWLSRCRYTLISSRHDQQCTADIGAAASTRPEQPAPPAFCSLAEPLCCSLPRSLQAPAACKWPPQQLRPRTGAAVRISNLAHMSSYAIRRGLF